MNKIQCEGDTCDSEVLVKGRCPKCGYHWMYYDHLNRMAHTYTGICPVCKEERTDLCDLDDPMMCGDCGLKDLFIGMGAVWIDV